MSVVEKFSNSFVELEHVPAEHHRHDLNSLIKVTLDRFEIIPQVDRWGWHRFDAVLHRNKRILSDLLAVNMVVREVSANGDTEHLDTVHRRCLSRLPAFANTAVSPDCPRGAQARGESTSTQQARRISAQ